jgi:hypothetical protein
MVKLKGEPDNVQEVGKELGLLSAGVQRLDPAGVILRRSNVTPFCIMKPTRGVLPPGMSLILLLAESLPGAENTVVSVGESTVKVPASVPHVVGLFVTL